MLRKRLISALIIISIFLGMIWLDYQLGTSQWLDKPGLILMILSIFVGMMGVSELLWFFDCADGQSKPGIKPWAAYLGTGVVILSAYVPLLWDQYSADCSVGQTGWILFGTAAAVGIAFISQMIGYRHGARVMDDVARTILIVCYLGLLVSFWAPIRLIPGNAWGIVAFLSLCATVKMSDVGAYTIGKSFGKHKLAPNLSPGKTIEGVGGGIIGGCIGAAIVFYLVAPSITGTRTSASWITVIAFGVVVTLAGIVGDLAESLLKREGGVKDSSRWLPGLGGVLDVVDSVLVAGPVVLAFWTSGLLDPVTE